MTISSREFVLDYVGCNSLPARCDVTRTDLRDGRTLFIVAERPDNRGASVTNSAEIVATLLCLGNGTRRAKVSGEPVTPGNMVYIQHYPPGLGEGRVPEYDLVTFKLPRGSPTFTEPAWRPARHDDFAELGVPDPRPFAVDHDAPEVLGGASLYTVLDNRRLGGAPEARVLGWFSDHSALHGPGAYKRARARLGGLYAHGDKVISDPEPGDPVCFMVPMQSGVVVFGHGLLDEVVPAVPFGFVITPAELLVGQSSPGEVVIPPPGAKVVCNRTGITDH